MGELAARLEAAEREIARLNHEASRLRLAAALAGSRDRLRYAFDAAGVVAWEVDAATGLIVHTESTGGGAGLNVGSRTDLQALTHPDDRPRVVAEFEAAMARRGDFRAEYRLVVPDRGVVWVESFGRPISAPGEPLRMGGVIVDITRSKQVERALRESETRLRLALEVGQLGDWSWSETTNKVTLPEMAAKLCGLPAGDYDLDSILGALILPDDLDRVRAVLTRTFQTGEDCLIEYRIRRMMGDMVELRVRGRAYRNRDGRITGLIGVVQDVTAQRAAEREIELRRGQFEKIALASPSLVYIQDIADGRTIYANPRVADVLGYPPEAIIGRPHAARDLIHPDDVAGLLSSQDDMRRLGEGQTLEVSYRMRAADGRWVWLLDRIVAFRRDEAGVVRQILGSAADVTALKQGEAALRESEQRLDLAIRAARIGVFDWDIAADAVIWTPQHERLFGEVGRKQTGFGKWTDRVPPDELARMAQVLVEATAERRSEVSFTYAARRADGIERRYETWGNLLYDGNGVLVRMVGVTMDVTERHEAIVQQQLLARELNHRVKNTLAVVQSLALSSRRSAGTIDAFLEGFTGRLRALAASHDLLTRESWLGAPLGEVVGRTVAAFGSDRFAIEGPPVTLASGVAVNMGMAIHELATNAVKYGALSAPGGRVTIQWTIDAGNLVLDWREEGGPRVAAPSRRGFGSRLIEQGVTRELGGHASLRFAPEGVRCTLRLALGDKVRAA